MNNKCKLISFVLIVLIILPYHTLATDTEQLELYMELSSWKYAKDKRTLIASMTAEDDSGEIYGSDIPVVFYVVSDTTNIELGTAISNIEGKAVLILDRGIELPWNEEGYITFISRFDGNERFGMAEAELAIKDAWINISFYIEDSVKMIRYEGGIIDVDGLEIPLADDDIYLYVPRMFNLMPIEEGWLEEDGMGSMEFPLNLIGDSIGNIKVIEELKNIMIMGTCKPQPRLTGPGISMRKYKKDLKEHYGHQLHPCG